MVPSVSAGTNIPMSVPKNIKKLYRKRKTFWFPSFEKLVKFTKDIFLVS